MSETIVGARRPIGAGHSEPRELTEAAPGQLSLCEPVGVSPDAAEASPFVLSGSAPCRPRRHGSPLTLGQQAYEILHDLLRYPDDPSPTSPFARVLE